MTATDEAKNLAIQAALAASDKLATDILAIDVSEHVVITDVFVLCSAANEPQVKAVVDAVQERLLQHGAKPLRREGEQQADQGRLIPLEQMEKNLQTWLSKSA